MDYDTLVANKETDGSIMNWVNDNTISPTTILTEAQAHIYAKLRVQEMIVKTSSFAVPANVEEIAAPDGCLEIIHMRWLTPDLMTLGKLIMDDLDNKRMYNNDGTLVLDIPRWYGLADDMIAFCVLNDVARVAFLRWFSLPDPLGPNNQTNFVTVKYPRLLRCFCLAYANEFKKQFDEADSWLQKGLAQIEEIAQTMDDDRLRGFSQYPTAE